MITRQLAAKTILQRESQRKNMDSFFQRAFKILDPGVHLKYNWHIGYICEHLEALKELEIQHLLINMPPRELKSILCTVCFPAYVLGDDPTERIVCSSYTKPLAQKLSRDTRSLILSKWFQNLFPRCKLAHDQNEKTNFQTTMRGFRYSTSTDGSVTGEGGNYLINDDPVNPRRAMSKADRERANTWLSQTWGNRKNDPSLARELMVMQRLHQSDPSQTFIDLVGAHRITHVLIPQVAPEKTIIIFPKSGKELVREKGDLLNPSRNGPEQIAEKRKRLGTYGFESQEQQQPSPDGGGTIKLSWFKRYKVAPILQPEDQIILSSDTANKDQELNDNSVIQTWLKRAQDYYLLNVWKQKVIFPDLLATAKSIPASLPRPPVKFYIEDKGSGQQLIQCLRTSTNLTIEPFDPTNKGNKEVRVSNASPAIENGRFWLPEEAPWLPEFEDEIRYFPNAAHDDQVDAMVQLIYKELLDINDFFVG